MHIWILSKPGGSSVSVHEKSLDKLIQIEWDRINELKRIFLLSINRRGF